MPAPQGRTGARKEVSRMSSISRRDLIAAAAAAALAGSFAVPAFAQDLPKIEFLYSPYADYAPFFVAEELGYFDDFGVDVTLSPKGDTAETIQMLASGNIEAGAATWASSLFNAHAFDRAFPLAFHGFADRVGRRRSLRRRPQGQAHRHSRPRRLRHVFRRQGA
jgi:hypothetical protein